MGMQEDIAANAAALRNHEGRIQALEMTDSKPWWMSKGIMGPLASISLKVLAVLAYMKGVDHEIILALLGGSGVGDIVGAIGRATAKKVIR